MSSGPFKASHIAELAELWLSNEIAYRLADRLIQRERKAGHIKPVKPFPTWEWVKQ